MISWEKCWWSGFLNFLEIVVNLSLNSLSIVSGSFLFAEYYESFFLICGWDECVGENLHVVVGINEIKQENLKNFVVSGLIFFKLDSLKFDRLLEI